MSATATHRRRISPPPREADREVYDDVAARFQEAYREGRTVEELRVQTRPRIGAVVR